MEGPSGSPVPTMALSGPCMAMYHLPLASKGMKLGAAQDKHHCWHCASAEPGCTQGGLVEQAVRRSYFNAMRQGHLCPVTIWPPGSPLSGEASPE